MTTYEPVIGLEVHAQLQTRTKLFCGCATAFGSGPNTNVCPVCLGLPGALPVMNRQAVRLAVRAALALGCEIHRESLFARKQYFYPDLPKGYQISQYERPFSSNGSLEIEMDGAVRVARITRVHMEEDAGKSVHGVGGDSIVDLNRACTPLVEIVGEPDLRSSAEAAAYMRALREVLVAIGVNDGNLEEGSFRCDANVSIRPRGETALGTRSEIKNLNSFRFLQKAIDVEIARQTAILDAGGRIVQETRSFDPDSGKTATLRSKEDAHDYRYFPDPDLPPLIIDDELVTAERAAIGELPRARRTRWVEKLGLTAAAAQTLSVTPATVAFFEDVIERFPEPVKVANWMMTEVLRGVTGVGAATRFAVTPVQVADLLRLVDNGKISGKQAKAVYQKLEGTERDVADIVEESGMRQVSDDATLVPICERIIAANDGQVTAYREGKVQLLGYFVGQVMRETRGSANPKLVSDLLERLLKGDAS